MQAEDLIPLLLIVGAAFVFALATIGVRAWFDMVAFGLLLMALFQFYYLVT